MGQSDRNLRVRIYRPAKTAMQSGRARTHRWVLEFAPLSPRLRDPLMGWTGTADARSQVRLTFTDKAEAIAYAEHHGYRYQVEEPQERSPRAKAYADNFATSRRGPWTH